MFIDAKRDSVPHAIGRYILNQSSIITMKNKTFKSLLNIVLNIGTTIQVIVPFDLNVPFTIGYLAFLLHSKCIFV